MYVPTLTGEDVEFGKQLTRALRESKFPYLGTLWLYDEPANEWHFTVATELVDKLGPRNTYSKLSDITRRLSATDDQLLKISVISPHTSLYAALRSVFAPAASVEGARLAHTMVNDVFVDNAYLYEIR